MALVKSLSRCAAASCCAADAALNGRQSRCCNCTALRLMLSVAAASPAQAQTDRQSSRAATGNYLNCNSVHAAGTGCPWQRHAGCARGCAC